MSPLRAESSTVSLAPRERRAAKRRAKAIRQGQPISHTSTNGVKKLAKAPAPTLATTRKRRAAALNIAYIDRPDGYHIKQVVRRLATPDHAPPIPYLRGQEDIPPSDDKSDDGTASTATTTPEIGFPVGDFNIDVDADTCAPSDEIDYDAEGETDDEVMQDISGLAPPLSSHEFDTVWEPQPTSVPQIWPSAPSQTDDLIGDANEEDLRVLFDGLDSLPTSFSNDFPATFPNAIPATSSVPNAQDLDGLGTFAMHQLHTAVDDLCDYRLSHQHSHSSNRLAQPSIADNYPPLIVPGRASSPNQPSVIGQSATVHPSASISNPLACPTPLPSHSATFSSRLGTPVNPSNRLRTPAPTRQTARSNTRDLVSQARSQARSPSLVIPRPVSTPCDDLPAANLLRVPPLRKSLQLPSFMGGEDCDDTLSDEEQPRPSTPITLDDTDIGLNESTSRPITQARQRATRYLNVHVLPRHSTQRSPCVPTVQQLQLNALRVYKLNRRRNRNRSTTATESARSRNILSSGQLSDEQRAVVSQMEFHVLKDILCVNPWPELEAREEYLSGAEHYATRLTGISGDDVFSQRFFNTIFARMSGNRSNSLAKISCMVEHEFGVSEGDKQMIYQLMDKDLFLFPTDSREPSDYFCVGALGSALEILLFKSSKPIGLVFMEELCKPDSPADWHQKLCDRTARKGIPPGLLALAATQMYWALERLYMGSKLSFDEQHYRAVWNRYFQALTKLPHLGRLRIDMLDRMKEYYMAHWPGEEPDEDEVAFPAW